MTNNQLTDVKFFTKKTVTISAIQWTGDNLAQVIEFTGKHPRWGEWFKSMDEYIAHVRDDGNRFKIFTLEGVMDALPGDWIIRGVQGERYPCKPDIFAETYSPAELQERRKADSEPVAYTDERNLGYIDRGRETAYLWGKQNSEASDVPLYRHAQQPVVPEKCPAEIRDLIASHSDALFNDDDAQEIWNACRAAMLQAGYAVRDLSTPVDPQVAEYEQNVMQAGNSPVIPDGYVMVPKELTCEMDDAAWEAYHNTRCMSDIWDALLSLAPQLPGSEPATVPGKWISVSERMPEDRTQVILWDAEIGEVTSGHYSHKTQTFYHCGDAIENEITHWMPTPAAPQEENP